MHHQHAKKMCKKKTCAIQKKLVGHVLMRYFMAWNKQARNGQTFEKVNNDKVYCTPIMLCTLKVTFTPNICLHKPPCNLIHVWMVYFL